MIMIFSIVVSMTWLCCTDGISAVETCELLQLESYQGSLFIYSFKIQVLLDNIGILIHSSTQSMPMIWIDEHEITTFLIWTVWNNADIFKPFVLSVLQDRADRAARYAKNQEDDKTARQDLLQARQAEQDARKEALVRERR